MKAADLHNRSALRLLNLQEVATHPLPLTANAAGRISQSPIGDAPAVLQASWSFLLTTSCPPPWRGICEASAGRADLGKQVCPGFADHRKRARAGCIRRRSGVCYWLEGI
jgi:hypothetical protein